MAVVYENHKKTLRRRPIAMRCRQKNRTFGKMSRGTINHTRSKNVILLLSLGMRIAPCGCANVHRNLSPAIPLQGGQNATTSILPSVPLPAGMQRYASHGYIRLAYGAAPGSIETYRGNVDSAAAAMTMNSGPASRGLEFEDCRTAGPTGLSMLHENGKKHGGQSFPIARGI